MSAHRPSRAHTRKETHTHTETHTSVMAGASAHRLSVKVGELGLRRVRPGTACSHRLGVSNSALPPVYSRQCNRGGRGVLPTRRKNHHLGSGSVGPSGRSRSGMASMDARHFGSAAPRRQAAPSSLPDTCAVAGSSRCTCDSTCALGGLNELRRYADLVVDVGPCVGQLRLLQSGRRIV
jgi:hypothetical protein